MLDVTFPKFGAAKKTDVVLAPIRAIEEHNSHLPLVTDAINTTAQVFQMKRYLPGSAARRTCASSTLAFERRL